jgi:hypothetical protein
VVEPSVEFDSLREVLILTALNREEAVGFRGGTGDQTPEAGEDGESESFPILGLLALVAVFLQKTVAPLLTWEESGRILSSFWYCIWVYMGVQFRRWSWVLCLDLSWILLCGVRSG